ncbi:hypothetical protein MKW92_044054 [Papaver armeniacum]|nr:hypothetical protein MKW92_044054 [Papaver armeniacum]
MALQNWLYAGNSVRLRPVYVTQLPGKYRLLVPRSTGKSQAEEFIFQRRFFVGIGTASAVVLGGNFVGVTSFLLGLSPQTGRDLKLDVLYPIVGYSRCLEPNEGFEFIYPASWVGDQTLLRRAVGKAELERSLDLPPLNDKNSTNRRRGSSSNEPKVAFGPPGSNGELNVSVIVSAVPLDFSIEAFGGPKEIGETVVRTIAGPRSGVKATLIESTVRQDSTKQLNYYKLEFQVESSSFRRHNIAVCCAENGRLFTLNAQAPESIWSKVKQQFNTVADSFHVTT